MTITRFYPEGGWPMTLRHNWETGEPFLGCRQYPRCQATEPLPEDVRLRIVGAPELPGFGE